MKRGIVYYATRYGSTQEIAEAFANKLEIPCKNVMDVVDGNEIDNYEVLILGSPIYFEDIYQDMKHFLTSFFIQIGSKVKITYAVYGATKGYLDTNYAQTFADYFQPPPKYSMKFLGRATRTSLGEDDYRKLEIFYKNRLNAELSDFDYFDENKIDDAVSKIKEVLE